MEQRSERYDSGQAVMSSPPPSSSSSSRRSMGLRRRSTSGAPPSRVDMPTSTFSRVEASQNTPENPKQPFNNVPPPFIAPYVGEGRYFAPQSHPAWFGGQPPTYPPPPVITESSISHNERSSSASYASPHDYKESISSHQHPPSPPASRGQRAAPPAPAPSVSSSGFSLPLALETKEMIRSRSGGSTHEDPFGGQSRPQSNGSMRSGSAGSDSGAGPASSIGQTPTLELQRPRRTRALMTRQQSAALTKLWKITKFPSGPQREDLGAEVALTPRQVQVWFQNQRQKFRRHTLQYGGVPEGENVADYQELMMSPRSRRLSQELEDQESSWASTAGGATFSSVSSSSHSAPGSSSGGLGMSAMNVVAPRGEPSSSESSFYFHPNHHHYPNHHHLSHHSSSGQLYGGRSYSDNRVIIGSAQDSRLAPYSVPPPLPPHTIRSAAGSRDLPGIDSLAGIHHHSSYSSDGGRGGYHDERPNSKSDPGLSSVYRRPVTATLDGSPPNRSLSRYPPVPHSTFGATPYSPPPTAPSITDPNSHEHSISRKFDPTRPSNSDPEPTNHSRIPRISQSSSPELGPPPRHLPPSLAALALSGPIGDRGKVAASPSLHSTSDHSGLNEQQKALGEYSRLTDRGERDRMGLAGMQGVENGSQRGLPGIESLLSRRL